MKTTENYGTCKTCSYPLRPLFTSLACDQCDGIVKPPTFERGWVLWDSLGDNAQALLVFRSYHDAHTFQGTLDHLSMAEKEIKSVQLEQHTSWYFGHIGVSNGQQYTVSSKYVWVVRSRFDFRPPNRDTAFILP